MFRICASVLTAALIAGPCRAAPAVLPARAQLKASSLIEGYARCAGAYDVMAQAQGQVGNEASAKSLHDGGNSAEVTSAMLAVYLLDAPPAAAVATAAQRRKSQATYFVAMVENGGSDRLIDELKKCTGGYLDLQGAVAAAANAWISGGGSNTASWYALMTQALQEHLAGTLATVDR